MYDVNEKMLIAMAKGNSKNIKLKAADMSFADFAKFCSKPQTGGKHESYFTRGVPLVEELYTSGSGKEYHNGRFRHDSSIEKADFLIIDADNSGSSPKDVHDILSNMDYIHFIYTSHSHSAKSNNFRVVLPCSISCKFNMVSTAKDIINKIKEAGAEVNYVKEMGAWSQAWYLPTRDDIDDGLFEYYEQMDGTEYLEVIGEAAAKGNLSAFDEAEPHSIEEIIEIISKGKEGLHHAIRDYSEAKSKDGMNKKEIAFLIRAMMMGLDMSDSRILSRFNDVERIVDGASDSTSKLEMEIFEKDTSDEGVSWPPGLMGELARSVYDYSTYPNKVISIITAFGLIAGVAGRRFNISGSGLNLYLTLLMDTGGGKSTIDDFISRTLNEADIFSGSNVFMGKRNFTGPKALMDDLNGKRCFVSVFSEAGFMFSSKSGDKAGLTRTILDLYGKSGHKKVMQSEGYSSDKNNIPAVVAPCFSMVNESTPGKFLEALRGGTETGEITRMHIFRVKPEGHRVNRNVKYHLSVELFDKIKHLMSRCNATQKDDDPDVSNFDVTDDMWDFIDDCMKISQDNVEDDPIRSRMYSRAGLKSLKIAALCSVLNSEGKKGDRNLKVNPEDWKWAKEFSEWEMSNLECFFDNNDGVDLFGIVMKYVYPKYSKLLNGDYRDKQSYLTKEQRKNKWIPEITARRLMEKTPAVKDCSPFRTTTGFEFVTEYMVKRGYISINKGRIIKINDSFIEDYNDWR